MRLAVYLGSRNESKLQGLQQALTEWPEFQREFEIKTIEVDSGVRLQPLSLSETAQGAYNRAKWVASYSYLPPSSHDRRLFVGVESGITPILLEGPLGDPAQVEFTVACVMFDDNQKIFLRSLGVSSAWQVPGEYLPTGARPFSTIVAELGAPEAGKNGTGISGIHTKGALTRIKLTYEACRNALASISASLTETLKKE